MGRSWGHLPTQYSGALIEQVSYNITNGVHDFAILLCLASPRISLTCPNDAEKCHHIRLRLFGIRENIGALLSENTRDSVEQVSLKAERQGSSRVQYLFTRLGDVDLLDGLLGQSLLVIFANSGHQPG